MEPRSGRLYLLDLVRGLASLSVVVFHYQHFYFVSPGLLPADFDRSLQPFWAWLSAIYVYGAAAVQVFFVLSGFVFFHQYAEAIRRRQVGAGEFFILRFSRLYPLHFATLLIVAVGQAISMHLDGQFVVYPCNDFYRFVLNALFIVNWLPESQICFSFNAPVWSVSVEILLYLLFFVFALTLPQPWGLQLVLTLVAVAFGLTVHYLGGYDPLGQPFFGFFSGGLVFLLWKKVIARKALIWMLLPVPLLVAWATFTYSMVVFDIVAFPSLIFALALLQALHRDLGRHVRVVGDITYATYLLHFPLQLFLVLLTRHGLLPIDFTKESGWLFFFAVLIAISVATYYLFELPVQKALRNFALAKLRRPDDIAYKPG